MTAPRADVAPTTVAGLDADGPLLPLPADLSGDVGAPALSTGESAFGANLALPIAAGANPAAPSFTLAAANIHQMRALDCLAQAVYYEAASEPEDGQRAVAQVVLNRVRHPSWPSSVCGVVYQGPMRPGGGCQFTFTCDGALARAPGGEAWARARRIAAEALAGRVYAPVGLATFYHASYVMPSWAPRLEKVAVIGLHNFYRLPGTMGRPAAFSAPYAGVEPVARPNPILVRYAGRASAADLPAWAEDARRAAAVPTVPVAEAVPAIPLEPVRPVTDESRIQPEFRNSGQWRSDAPAALTGR